jgi:hypothetical protein
MFLLFIVSLELLSWRDVTLWQRLSLHLLRWSRDFCPWFHLYAILLFIIFNSFSIVLNCNTLKYDRVSLWWFHTYLQCYSVLHYIPIPLLPPFFKRWLVGFIMLPSCVCVCVCVCVSVCVVIHSSLSLSILSFFLPPAQKPKLHLHVQGSKRKTSLFLCTC